MTVLTLFAGLFICAGMALLAAQAVDFVLRDEPEVPENAALYRDESAI